MILSCSSKLLGIDLRLAIQNLADQISMLLYGKKLNDCLGKGQTIMGHKKRPQLYNQSIEIHIPLIPDDQKLKTNTPCQIFLKKQSKHFFSNTRPISALIMDIENMTRHAQHEGISISILE